MTVRLAQHSLAACWIDKGRKKTLNRAGSITTFPRQFISGAGEK